MAIENSSWSVISTKEICRPDAPVCSVCVCVCGGGGGQGRGVGGSSFMYLRVNPIIYVYGVPKTEHW